MWRGKMADRFARLADHGHVTLERVEDERADIGDCLGYGRLLRSRLMFVSPKVLMAIRRANSKDVEWGGPKSRVGA